MVSVTIKVPYINPNDLKYFDVSLIDFKLKNISIVFLYVSRIKHFTFWLWIKHDHSSYTLERKRSSSRLNFFVVFFKAGQLIFQGNVVSYFH